MTDLVRVRGRAGKIALAVGAVVGVLFGVAALLSVVLDVRVLVFRSGSMSPAIPTGSLALARTVPASQLREGDVVTVRTSTGSRVTHRIVSVERRGRVAELVLKGDANKTPDVEPYRVREADRAFYTVPWVGYLGAALISPVGLFLLGLYAAAMLRIVLAKAPPPRHKEVPKDSSPTVPLAAVATVLGLAGLVAGTLGSRTATTWAAWNDSVGTVGSTFSAGSVPAPGSFSCALNVVRNQATFSWSAVAGATRYVFHYGSGGATTYDAGTNTSVIYTAGSLNSGSGTAWVTAEHSYGSVTWTSVASTTRNYSFTVGVFTSC